MSKAYEIENSNSVIIINEELFSLHIKLYLQISQATAVCCTTANKITLGSCDKTNDKHCIFKSKYFETQP